MSCCGCNCECLQAWSKALLFVLFARRAPTLEAEPCLHAGTHGQAQAPSWLLGAAACSAVVLLCCYMWGSPTCSELLLLSATTCLLHAASCLGIMLPSTLG